MRSLAYGKMGSPGGNGGSSDGRRFRLNSRGVSLPGLLAGMAASIVVLLGVANLFENLAELRHQVEIQNEVESIVGLIQDRLSLPSVCAQALQPGIVPNGRPLVWADFSTKLADQSVFGLIQYGGLNGAYLRYAGALMNSNGTPAGIIETMTSFSLRQPDPTLFEGNPTITTEQIYNSDSGKTETITFVSAKLVFQINGRLRNLGKIQERPDRIIDLVAGFNANHEMVSCAPADKLPTQSISCALAACPAKPPGCEQLHYVNAYDASGYPLCQCSITCPQPPTGPPGTWTPPVVVSSGGDKGDRGAANHAPIGSPTGSDGDGGGEGGDGGGGGDGGDGGGGER